MPVLGSIGPRADIVLRRGTTFAQRRVSVMRKDPTHTDPTTDAPLVPVPLTGAVIVGQIRKYLNGQVDPYVTSFDVDTTHISLQSHQYYIGLSATKTELLLAGMSLRDSVGVYEYDFKVTFAGGIVVPHMHGQVRVYRNVTA